MGAVESKTMVEYLGEHDKQNYEYYSGERFVLIPAYFYPPTPATEDDDGYSWYSWYWK
jgi:hypothetical protein